MLYNKNGRISMEKVDKHNNKVYNNPMELEQETAFYSTHQAEFREKYLRKWLVIADEPLFGVYDTPKEAVEAASQHYEIGEFILHRPIDDDMTIEVGPMGVIHIHRPYDTEDAEAGSVMITSGGDPLKLPYACPY
jgi:hypothetical protein